MIHTRPFDYDPVFGLTELWHYDDETNTGVIETIQDSTAIIEANKWLYADVDEQARWKDGLHHVARIPIHLYKDLQQKGIAFGDAAMRRWLNDPDNRYFRTRPGVI